MLDESYALTHDRAVVLVSFSESAEDSDPSRLAPSVDAPIVGCEIARSLRSATVEVIAVSNEQ